MTGCGMWQMAKTRVLSLIHGQTRKTVVFEVWSCPYWFRGLFLTVLLGFRPPKPAKTVINPAVQHGGVTVSVISVFSGVFGEFHCWNTISVISVSFAIK